MLCSLHNYFCIGSNKGREGHQKSLLATLYSLQKATFNIFLATFEQRLEKLRETFWEISCRAICEKPYLTSPIFFKPPNTLTHTKFQHPQPPAPPQHQHLHTPFSILNELSPIHVLSIQTLSTIISEK